MSVAATGFERATPPRRAWWTNGARGGLRRLLAVLDRLVPQRGAREAAELPPEWFKYPPF